MHKKTAWIPKHRKPVREGYYEAKEKSTDLVFDVKWKTLQDTDKPSFYVHGGYLGPFSLWQDVTHRVWQWRGAAEAPNGEGE
jgi:hypothetical protein